MSHDLFRIVYCSRNAVGMDAPGLLDRILAVSRRNNAAERVTGALLYVDGNFAQVLEGDFAAVQRTFERIQADERHQDLVLMQANTVGERLFGEWAMGRATAENPDAASQVLHDALLHPGDKGALQVAELLDVLVRREEWVSALA